MQSLILVYNLLNKTMCKTIIIEFMELNKKYGDKTVEKVRSEIEKNLMEYDQYTEIIKDIRTSEDRDAS